MPEKMSDEKANEILKSVQDSLSKRSDADLIRLLDHGVQNMAVEYVGITFAGTGPQKLIRHLMLHAIIIDALLKRYEDE